MAYYVFFMKAKEGSAKLCKGQKGFFLKRLSSHNQTIALTTFDFLILIVRYIT